MNKTAAFYTLGCKVNSYETDAMRELFEKEGYEIVDFKDKADIYIVNTCTVTNIADRKSRQMLHQAKKRNPNAIIVAVGCYVQAAEEELLEDCKIDIVIGNNKKSDIINMIDRYYKSETKEDLVIDINSKQEYETLNITDTSDKTRIFIKIQEGCNRYCSYCIIPYVRGRIRSRDQEEILNEVEILALKGYKEFVLTGIHLSSYGHDLLDKKEINEKMPLADIISKISKVEGVERIRLGSLEPMVITEEFVKVISSIKSFCPHFHLSLQSGSDTVLKRMNRRYTAQEYYEKVLLLKKEFDYPSFTTDIIVGFPGETEEEFEETKEFLEKVTFLNIHVFKYSKREGTKAATMPNQINNQIKSKRSSELIRIGAKMSKNYREHFIGKSNKILVENEEIINNIKYYLGHNERFIKLAFASKSEFDYLNKIIEVRNTDYLNDEIMLCEIMN
ncbi:MAG TPA: tRNA (N(6)-L-threonylcarbamoyladenosine(37)-C(2))-methylthiotransferase MtaB [Clostridiales bacterium]|nr:tRNA (N(6)-L-threonylcarbamoyladenosine(37)-C(2))-methylthiotransferase MtaB [Clostridiales bacterium]